MDKPMTKKEQVAAEQAEALAKLRKMLKPGDTVYCILRHRAASGMSRTIDLVIPYQDYAKEYPLLPADKAEFPGQKDYAAKPKLTKGAIRLRSIGWLTAKLVGDRWDSDKSGIRIGGYGMDMGFSLVYSLGQKLWPKGTPKPHGKRNGEPDSAGGYALKHEWL